MSDSLTVLTLNTMLWYEHNKLINSSKDPNGQFEWLQQELQMSRDSGKHVSTMVY